MWLKAVQPGPELHSAQFCLEKHPVCGSNTAEETQVHVSNRVISLFDRLVRGVSDTTAVGVEKAWRVLERMSCVRSELWYVEGHNDVWKNAEGVPAKGAWGLWLVPCWAVGGRWLQQQTLWPGRADCSLSSMLRCLTAHRGVTEGRSILHGIRVQSCTCWCCRYLCGTADCTLPGPEEGHQAVGCSVLSLPCGVQAGTVAVCIWGRDVCGVVIAVLHWDGDKHPCWLMALAGSWRWGRPHFCALMWKLGGQACYSFPSRLRGSLFPHRAVSLPGANRAPSGLWLRHWVGAAAIRISSSLMWAVCL